MFMPFPEQVLFLCLIALGCYVQAITGFALGLLVIAGSALFGLMSIEAASIVVTIVTLANAGLLLIRSGFRVRWRKVIPVLVACIPTVYLGVVLLDVLNEHGQDVLRILLSLTIVVSSLSLIYNPRPRSHESGNTSFVIYGSAAGILGGMFAATGPPLIFHFYRQPLPIWIIRDSLLMIFLTVAIVRIVFLMSENMLPVDAAIQAVIALPVVLIFSFLGDKLPMPFDDRTSRRFAFLLLTVAGVAVSLPVLSG